MGNKKAGSTEKNNRIIWGYLMLSVDDIKKIKLAMTISTIKTFEEMAFLEVVQAKENHNEENTGNKISIDIIEPQKMIVLLDIHDDLLKIIVENIYSNNIDNVNEKDINDCIEELLNVLTGSFLKEYYGHNIKYKMELPQIIVDTNELSNNKEIIKFFFNAEGFLFKIKIII